MRRGAIVLLSLALLLVGAGVWVALAEDDGAMAQSDDSGSGCAVANAAGPTDPPRGARNARSRKQAKRRGTKRGATGSRQKISLQGDPQSASKSVNLGDDREAEEVVLRVNVSPRLSAKTTRKLSVAAEQFANSSETGETVTFPEPTFSKLKRSGDGKRIRFTMCVDPPNDLPAGKYVSTVMLEGPSPVEPAVMTVTLNAKDGHGFIIAALIAAFVSFLVLLYKGAGEKRVAALAAAEKLTGDERTRALRDAESWRRPLSACVGDLGWWVPTVASVAAAFALLYAAYDANPAWGEGGLVTNAIAVIGTALAAIGARTVFTQNSTSR